jgi:hypothetical protein
LCIARPRGDRNVDLERFIGKSHPVGLLHNRRCEPVLICGGVLPGVAAAAQASASSIEIQPTNAENLGIIACGVKSL